MRQELPVLRVLCAAVGFCVVAASYARAEVTKSDVDCSSLGFTLSLEISQAKTVKCQKSNWKFSTFGDSAGNFEPAGVSDFAKATFSDGRALLIYRNKMTSAAYFKGDVTPEQRLKSWNSAVRKKSADWSTVKERQAGGHIYKVQNFNLAQKYDCMIAWTGLSEKYDGYRLVLMVMSCQPQRQQQSRQEDWLDEIKLR